MGLTRPKHRQLQTAITNFDDPLIELNASAQGANTNDLGILFNRGSSGNNVGIIWDRTAQAFAFVQTTSDGDATGDIILSAYADLQVKTIVTETFAFPAADGTADQVLSTDGNGNVTWVDQTGGAGGGITAIIEDTNPVLGGGLASGGFDINMAAGDQIVLSDGTVGAPALAFSSNPDVGLYYASSELRVAFDSADIVQLTGTDVRLNANLLVSDNDHIRLGTGLDLDIYHNGGNSVIKNNTGGLFVEGASTTIAAFTQSAAKLYFSSAQKFETVTGGINITGDVTVSTAAPSADNQLTRKDYVDDNFVAITGDTMTGNLFISGSATPNIGLKPTAGAGYMSYTIHDLNEYWRAQFSYSDATGDVSIVRKSAADAQETKLILNSNKTVRVIGANSGDPGAAPVDDSDLANKKYVDDELADAASNMTVDTFVDGVDFTAGVTNILTLSATAGSENNITVQFDGITQHRTEYSLAGTTLTFTLAIPAYVGAVEVTGGSSLPVGTPSDATVTVPKLAADVIAYIDAANNVTVDNYVGGVDFTAGTTTQLTLSTTPDIENNVAVSFDGVIQHHTEYTLAGAVLTFSSAIPLGTLNVEAVSGTTLAIGTPSDGTVTEAKLDAAVQTKLNKDEVVYDTGVTTGVVDFLDITGLDLDPMESYDIIFNLFNAGGSTNGFTMFANQDYVGAYRTQITEFAGTGVSTNKVASPRIGFAGINGNASGHGKVYMSNNGGYYWTTDIITYVNGDIEHAIYAGFRDNPIVGQLTSLRISSTITNGIGIGSSFKIVRKLS